MLIRVTQDHIDQGTRDEKCMTSMLTLALMESFHGCNGLVVYAGATRVILEDRIHPGIGRIDLPEMAIERQVKHHAGKDVAPFDFILYDDELRSAIHPTNYETLRTMHRI